MSKTGWLVILFLVIGIAAYAAYDAHHATPREAGHDIQTAAQSTGNAVRDTSRDIAHDIKHDLTQ